MTSKPIQISYDEQKYYISIEMSVTDLKQIYLEIIYGKKTTILGI